MPAVRARQVCPDIRLTDEQAAIIQSELRCLQGSRSSIHQVPAREIVEAARDKKSAMHGIIWGLSDEELAMRHRCTLARNLVHSIRIEAVDGDGPYTEASSIMISPSPGAFRGYVPGDVVKESEYMTRQVEERAFARLNGWLNEFRAFQHATRLGPMWRQVRNALEACGKLDDTQKRNIAEPRRPSSSTASRRPAKNRKSPPSHRDDAR